MDYSHLATIFNLSHEISSPVAGTIQAHQRRRNNFQRVRSYSMDALNELDGDQLVDEAEAFILDVKGIKRSSSVGVSI